MGIIVNVLSDYRNKLLIFFTSSKLANYKRILKTKIG